MINYGSYQNNNQQLRNTVIAIILSYCNNLGGLYQWNEMMNYNSTAGGQGICPDNWHVPTDAEWYTMENFLDPSRLLIQVKQVGEDNVVGQKLKNSGSGAPYNWASGNTGTNESGFTALPGGFKEYQWVYFRQPNKRSILDFNLCIITVIFIIVMVQFIVLV